MNPEALAVLVGVAVLVVVYRGYRARRDARRAGEQQAWVDTFKSVFAGRKVTRK